MTPEIKSVPKTELRIQKSISINASTAKVWHALTNPELIKIYFFGTECLSEWKKGSAILYKGIYEGIPYEDKGNVIDIETEKFILYNYWSSFSGTEDIPANYSEIKYELSADENGTIFTIVQGGFKTQEAHDHSDKNWGYVMEGLKDMLEK
ncbi:uncharacterized protein YndB with AHSA1/START domain [Flavobacterium sp. HSC-32F16]|uniref:SRPBCC family protein n=1 Tax=Flavobacterium sp. HSC-32F16 TaxID=2910964 RepID=UPI0020A40418|nr:SRPBCC domain-containing protein [Flavobacterium sp. HSC-32F16]MCP2028547.1 uncharacterized protein YndB with AHSA1/START domain [Flavobacterium sp. HSC-32F16]